MKEIYIKRKAKHVCVVCGEKDERTIAGKIRCAKCEKKRKRNVTKVIKNRKRKKLSLCRNLWRTSEWRTPWAFHTGIL